MSTTHNPTKAVLLKQWAAVACVIMLGVLLLVQAFHTHMGSDADVSRSHCAICIVAHSPGVVASRQTVVFVPAAEVTPWAQSADEFPKSQTERLGLFIRPPPLS